MTGLDPALAKNLPGRLHVPAGNGEAVFRDRGSRFVAWAGRVDDPDALLAARDARQARHHDATHHVFAARFLVESRTHDDGEPSGTAGRPILQAILRADLYLIGVVVTRYFGGTKLGTGGLARAYGEAAARALDELPLRRTVPARRLGIRYEYEDTGAVMRLLDAVGATRRSSEWDGGPRLEVAVPAGEWDLLVQRLRDATAGRAELEPEDEWELLAERPDGGGAAT